MIITNAAWLFCFQYYTKNGDNNQIIYYQILLFGTLIQLETAILDVMVDFLQVVTLNDKSTISWVKTIEVGLYKFGGMLSGTLMIMFTLKINVSILFNTILFLMV